MRSSILQPWKWQLTGIGYSTVAQASGTHCPRNGLWTRSYAARCTTSQSAKLGLHPVIRVPNYMMDHYSFTDLWGMDGWVGHVGWPITDGLTTKWSPIQLAVWRRIGKVRLLPSYLFLVTCFVGRDQRSNHYATSPLFSVWLSLPVQVFGLERLVSKMTSNTKRYWLAILRSLLP